MGPVLDEIEVLQLPRWARVAFAARCALRVLPCYRLNDSHPELRPHVDSIVGACNLAAISASNGRYSPSKFDDSNLVDARDAAVVAAATSNASGDAISAAEAAIAALDCAGMAVVRNAGYVADAVEAAAAVTAGDDIGAAIRSDFEAVLSASKNGNWTDDTKVSQGVFGPMWPSGEPDWYPEGLRWQRSVLKEKNVEFVITFAATEVDSNSADQFSFYLDPGDAPPHVIQEVLEKLSDLQRACGGVGLEYSNEDNDIFELRGDVL